MKYEKPDIFLGSSALRAIEGSSDKQVPLYPDAPGSGNVAIMPAYEADE